MKFTFKANKPTGMYRSFFSTSVDIKIKGKKVGSIDPDFKIRLMVIKDDINEDGNPNCEWKWIGLTKKSTSIDEAKKFLNDNIEAITEKFNLKLSE